MRICFLMEPPRSKDSVTYEVLNGLQARGADVEVVTERSGLVDLEHFQFNYDMYLFKSHSPLAESLAAAAHYRGAQLLNEPAKARLYADSTLYYCDQRLASGAKLADDGDLEYALGSAIEVKAQLLGPAKGAEFVRAQLVRFADSPKGFRARLHKRLAMLTWTGKPAPELRAEDQVRGAHTTLASLRGKPVVIYVYSSTCGDCRASAPTLTRVRAKWESRGVQWVALTRWYNDDAGRERERTVVDSTWTATYSGMGDTPVVVSTALRPWISKAFTPRSVEQRDSCRHRR